MLFPKSMLTLSILAAASQWVWAEDAPETTQQLETIQLTAHPLVQTAADFAVADHVVAQKTLAERAATIGDALSDELGVYSNQYGSGSSRPVIRGQDGARVKVLQHASETIDVSTLSPDHAVMVDPLLAKQVEIIRGPSTLLYAAGTVGGLVNVTDNKIPTQMPEKGYEGAVNLRYNSGSDEKLASLGTTVALGDQVALRVEGLKRKANDYIAPDYYHEHDGELEKEHRVGNTFAEGESVNLGLSWIHDRGFTGVSYSKRQDQYGLPGHSHAYHDYAVNYETKNLIPPTTATVEDEHAGGPWIDLDSERYDFRTELNQPFAGFDKLRAYASYTDYAHDEKEGQTVSSRFESRGYDGRLELVHVPVMGWEGVIGVQYGQQKIDLSAPDEHEADPILDAGHEEHNHNVLMANSKTQKYSLFGLEHKQLGDVHVELGARLDHQKVNIDSEQQDYSGTGFSYSAAGNWAFAPNYKLSLVGSHQERLPLAQELYADGLHFATNTYELGNANLDKETSNNLELGLHYEKDKLDYHVHIYHNWFDDYIYAQTLDKKDNLRLVQYTQDQARFYGAEAQLGYQLTSDYKFSVFGDYVRGKIDNDNAPRVPAGRLGAKVDADFADGWSGMMEYYHVFNQDKTASYRTPLGEKVSYEDETQGYNMLNMGISYAGQYAVNNSYRVFLNANNLLDDQVYQHASFLSNIPQVGRNFTVGLEFAF